MSRRFCIYGLMLILPIVSGFGLITGCQKKPEFSAPPVEQNLSQFSVYVTSYPLKYFTERIAGNTIRIHYLVPNDIDPTVWQPTSSDIVQMQMGDLIFINGANYEPWLRNVSLAESKLINTSAVVQDQYIKTQDAFTHSHGPEGEHAHTGTATMTWLNLEIAIAQANTIRQALTQARPELATNFEENFTALKQDLQMLDKELQAVIEINPELPLIAAHPVYDYFAQRYALNLKSLSWESDKVPDEVQWEKFKNLLEQHPAQWMIWEDQPNAKTVAKLQSLGIESIILNPLDHIAKNGDFIEIMQKNIQILNRVY